MSVAVQTPYTETVANGSTAAFPFTFTAFAEEDLKVSLDGVEVASGFTVSGIGLATGGTVTWPSNLTAGTVVLIESRVVPERDADYSAFGGIPTDVLNLEFDRIWVALQYVLQRVKTSIKLPFTTETEPIIGSAATRALKYLGFDVSGNVSLADIPDLASTQAAQAAAEAAAATISGFENKGAWVTATLYAVNNLVREGGTTYICLLDHTSGTFATDLADVKWEIFAQKGDAGTGAGDLVAANNLSELTATAATARSNLGLGSAATKATGTAAGNVPVVGTASDTETVAGLSRRNTQAEAEAGTIDEGHMTPLKTAQAIAALTSSITSGTIQSTISGTEKNFPGIPAGVKKITISFRGVSLSGTGSLRVRLGDSGGIDATGYISTTVRLAAGAAVAATSSTSEFIILSDNSSFVYSGHVVLTLADAATNLWIETHSGKLNTAQVNMGGGEKALSGTLTQLSILTNGVDTFDGGSVNILYE